MVIYWRLLICFEAGNGARIKECGKLTRESSVEYDAFCTCALISHSSMHMAAPTGLSLLGLSLLSLRGYLHGVPGGLKHWHFQDALVGMIRWRIYDLCELPVTQGQADFTIGYTSAS